MGKAEPQRWQLRSPGGLATPQAGLVHRLGGPSGSAPGGSAWSRKPQSMQAMAPSSSLEPQEGQTVGSGNGAGGMATGIGGLAPLPMGGTATTAGLATGAAGAATGTAARAATAGGTMNGCLHDGQRTFFLPALSGTCIDLVQWGQRIICGIMLLDPLLETFPM